MDTRLPPARHVHVDLDQICACSTCALLGKDTNYQDNIPLLLKIGL